MNPVIARITLRGLLGRKRVVPLVLLPAVLLIFAVVLALVGGRGEEADTVSVLSVLGVGTLLPLVALIVGTGVLGPEIEDGAVIYLLSKPIPRSVVVLTKLAVAVCVTVVLAAVPVFLAGLVTGSGVGLAAAFTVGAAVGSIVYCALFVALGAVFRRALVIGLLYVLIWEGLVGRLIPNAGLFSVQQWTLAVSDALTSAPELKGAAGLGTAVPFALVVTVGATYLAVRRLRSLQLTGED